MQKLLAKQVGKYEEPNSASSFWKSACWIRLIRDPPQAATTFLWMPPSATEWIRKSSRKPWPRNSPRNETRRHQGKASQDSSLTPSILDFWRSANLHSAFLVELETRRSVGACSYRLGCTMTTVSSVPSFGERIRCPEFDHPECEAGIGLRRYLNRFCLLFHQFAAAVSQSWSEFWTANKNFSVRVALCSRLQRAQGKKSRFSSH